MVFTSILRTLQIIYWHYINTIHVYSLSNKKTKKRKQRKNLPELLDFISAVVISKFWVEWDSDCMFVIFSLHVIVISVMLKHDLHVPVLNTFTGRFISNWKRDLTISVSEHVKFSDLMVQILLHPLWSWFQTLRSIIMKIFLFFAIYLTQLNF